MRQPLSMQAAIEAGKVCGKRPQVMGPAQTGAAGPALAGWRSQRDAAVRIRDSIEEDQEPKRGTHSDSSAPSVRSSSTASA